MAEIYKNERRSYTNKREECKGCCMQNQHSAPFLQGLIDFNSVCPCSICIIKVMCEESCEEYETFCNVVAVRGEKQLNGNL